MSVSTISQSLLNVCFVLGEHGRARSGAVFDRVSTGVVSPVTFMLEDGRAGFQSDFQLKG